MRPDLFDIYGDYADGYCENAQPSALAHFYHAAGSVNFTRLPSYPEYELKFDQALESDAGRDTVAYAPIAQELFITLPWPRMFKADRDNLETFYKDVVKGTSEAFTYSNNAFGPAQPVRFTGALPVMPEVAYQQYEVAIRLRVDLNYPQMTSAGAPPAITGNRFVFGPCAIQVPVAIQGNSGSGLSKHQSLGRDSAGANIIYDKSRIIQRQHQQTIMHDYATFLALQAFFFSFVHGCAQTFTWVDQDEASRTVRLASPSIKVKQLAYDRFQTELSLIEESAA